MRVVDPEVRNVEREALAVEREAFALEREAGGLPIGEPVLQDLLTDAQALLEDDGSPDVTWQELLTAARITMELCKALLEQTTDEDRKQVLAVQYQVITGFYDTIEQQISPPPAAAAPKAARGRSAP